LQADFPIVEPNPFTLNRVSVTLLANPFLDALIVGSIDRGLPALLWRLLYFCEETILLRDIAQEIPLSVWL
jgi:hypothetical protein